MPHNGVDNRPDPELRFHVAAVLSQALHVLQFENCRWTKHTVIVPFPWSEFRVPVMKGLTGATETRL